MKTARIMALAGALALLFRALAFSQDNASDRGREVYAVQKCALCHSIAGIGGKQPPLDRVGTSLKPEDMRKWVRDAQVHESRFDY